MVEEDALTESETAELIESIEAIFNNILEESEDEDCDGEVCFTCGECVDEVNGEYECEDCVQEKAEYEADRMNESKVEVSGIEWDNDEKEVDDEDLDSTVVIDIDEDELDDNYTIEDAIEDKLDSVYGLAHKGWESYTILESKIEEGMTLKKTTSKQKMKAKKYRNSAAGKKTMKLAAKKRKKYATKISRCAEKGKTFSLKKMTCVKSKKRR